MAESQSTSPPSGPGKTTAEGIEYDGLLPAEANEHLRAVAKEYGEWTAIAPIYLGSALAFATGTQVPIQHVEKFKLDEQGLVARVNTKAAKRARGEEE